MIACIPEMIARNVQKSLIECNTFIMDPFYHTRDNFKYPLSSIAARSSSFQKIGSIPNSHSS